LVLFYLQIKFDENILKSSSLETKLFPTSMTNSNFLVFSESFYIERCSNKGYRYYLGQETKQPPPTNTRESKTDRKKRFIKLMTANNWTRAELAKHLGVSRAWITKVLND
jgi:transcriptional regulator of acetoin/glycerol metabolism